MTVPTLPEPRPEDEGRRLASFMAEFAASYENEWRDGEWGGETAMLKRVRDFLAAPPLTPHPAPREATDEGLRAAVREYLDALAVIDLRDYPRCDTAESVRIGTALAALRAALQAGG